MKKASELMTKNPDCVKPTDDVRRAAELMRNGDFGFVPVVDDQFRLQGVVTDRDIAIRCVAEGRDGSCKVADVMTRDNLDTVHPDDSIKEVFNLMERDQVRRIPVVGDDDRVLGVIAQADVAMHSKEKQAGEVVEKISEPGHRAGH